MDPEAGLTAQGLTNGEPAVRDPRARTVPRVSIILPAYNEEAGLGLVLDRLFTVIDQSYEVIVVDDGSRDATAAIAARFQCRLLRHRRNLGKGRAVKTAVAAAKGETIVIIDADHTYPVDVIPELARGLATHDVVSGMRMQRQSIPPMNRLGNWLLRTAICRLYGSIIEDPLTGFYAVRSRPLREMRLSSDGFGIESEIVIKAARMGLRVLNLPITYAPRRGASKLHPVRDGLRIMWTIASFLALYNPWLAFLLPGACLLTIGMAVMFLLIWQPIQVGGVEFSYNTMIAGSAIALLGMQIMIFGFAANLYAYKHWNVAADAVTNLFLYRRGRRGLFVLGAGLVLGGGFWGLRLLEGWIRSGFGLFTQTHAAIFVTFLFMIGVQLSFSVAFLGLFRGPSHEEEPSDVLLPETVTASV